MNEALIQLQDVVKTYRSQKNVFGRYRVCVNAVDHVDLVVTPGENLGLVGESGCGKTTLARLMLKLIPLDNGRIFLRGTDITALNQKSFRKHRSCVQMVFQDPYNSLDPRFTIRNILMEALSLDKNNHMTFAERDRKLIQALRSVRMNDDVLNRYPHEFSGGERQRIAIARALVMRPPLLILDEAVSSLDVIIQKELLELLLAIQHEVNLTYIFISHNLKVVRKVCHRIAVMYQGRIVEIAPRDNIFNNPVHPYTKELLSAAIDYKSGEKRETFVTSRDSRLVEHAPGHFVLKER